MTGGGAVFCYAVIMRRAVAWLLGGVVACASAVHAQDDALRALFGRQQKPLIDPAGYFAVVLPSGFDCQASPRQVRCTGNRGVQSLLTIDVVDVPPSATVELFVLNQMDAFKQKEHFKLLAKQKQTLDGHRALLASYTFDHYGNVQLPGFAQGLYMVKQTKAYVIHYESRADQVAVHKNDLDELYASFRSARLDGGGHPLLDDLKPKQVKSKDTLPDVDTALKSGF
jgi:hypothetical protein